MKSFTVASQVIEAGARAGGSKAMPSSVKAKSRWLLRSVAVLCAASALAGCQSEKEKEAVAQQMKNPIITNVGTFDGCEVKYVNRYYSENSFYLARCGSTTAATGREAYRSGKTTRYRDRLSITHELEELQKELSTLDARAAALARLSPAERAALGLSSDNAPSPDDAKM